MVSDHVESDKRLNGSNNKYIQRKGSVYSIETHNICH